MEDNGMDSAPILPGAASAVKYKASIYQSDEVTPLFGEAIRKLENLLGLKIWSIIQNDDGEYQEISRDLYDKFCLKKAEIGSGEKIGLLIHSPGGDAEYAYKITRLFQRRTENFYTIVPLYAKSAATLIALGGKEIFMGSEAELGPLDVQLFDPDKGYYDSALNAVQSLERLNAYALTAFDQAMVLLTRRMRIRKPETLMPAALDYATHIVRPLIEKIDTIELTKKSRDLKVAEDYAIRLMKANYLQADASRIASNLVERYSTHEFVIDRAEAGSEGKTPGKPLNLGLNIGSLPEEGERLFDQIMDVLVSSTLIGRIEEISP